MTRLLRCCCLICLSLVGAAWLTGCGGGGSAAGGNSNISLPKGDGTLRVCVKWPELATPQAIPATTKSIAVWVEPQNTGDNGNYYYSNIAVIVRPASEATLYYLPTGPVTVHAAAYDVADPRNTDASPLANAKTTATLQSGDNPPVSLKLGLVPSVAITSPTVNEYVQVPSGAPLTVTGTAAAPLGETITSVRVSHNYSLDWQTATGTTNWSYNLTLPASPSYYDWAIVQVEVTSSGGGTKTEYFQFCYRTIL